MTRTFCDRCGVETTGKVSGAIHGIADADEEGNGTNTDCFDSICAKCYRAWKRWMAEGRK